MRRLGSVVALIACAWPALAHGHAGSNAFVFVTAQGTVYDVRLDLAARDLDELVGLDHDGDGRVTWSEAESAGAVIADYARGHLRFSADGVGCSARPPSTTLQAVEHADGWYVVVPLRFDCGKGATISIDYSGVFDFDASHRAQLRLQAGADVSVTVLSPSNRHFEFATGAPRAGAGDTFRRYLAEGFIHVVSGLDHLLFLAGLFLPVALEWTGWPPSASLRSSGSPRGVGMGWQPVPTRRIAFRRAALVVSAFTVAHALTLCLVALGTLHPPTRWVEAGVAFSVAFAGFNNLVPLVAHRRLALLAGAFGLVHGASIGGALLEMGLPTSARVLALAAFNLGVEGAQLLPVVFAVFMTFRFRTSPAYRHWVLVPGSVVVTLCGLAWLAVRALGLPKFW